MTTEQVATLSYKLTGDLSGIEQSFKQAEAKHAELVKKLAGKPISLKIQLDESSLSAAIKRLDQKIPQNRTVRIRVEVDEAKLQQVEKRLQALGVNTARLGIGSPSGVGAPPPVGSSSVLSGLLEGTVIGMASGGSHAPIGASSAAGYIANHARQLADAAISQGLLIGAGTPEGQAARGQATLAGPTVHDTYAATNVVDGHTKFITNLGTAVDGVSQRQAVGESLFHMEIPGSLPPVPPGATPPRPPGDGDGGPGFFGRMGFFGGNPNGGRWTKPLMKDSAIGRMASYASWGLVADTAMTSVNAWRGENIATGSFVGTEAARYQNNAEASLNRRNQMFGIPVAGFVAQSFSDWSGEGEAGVRRTLGEASFADQLMTSRRGARNLARSMNVGANVTDLTSSHQTYAAARAGIEDQFRSAMDDIDTRSAKYSDEMIGSLGAKPDLTKYKEGETLSPEDEKAVKEWQRRRGEVGTKIDAFKQNLVDAAQRQRTAGIKGIGRQASEANTDIANSGMATYLAATGNAIGSQRFAFESGQVTELSRTPDELRSTVSSRQLAEKMAFDRDLKLSQYGRDRGAASGWMGAVGNSYGQSLFDIETQRNLERDKHRGDHPEDVAARNAIDSQYDAQYAGTVMGMGFSRQIANQQNAASSLTLSGQLFAGNIGQLRASRDQELGMFGGAFNPMAGQIRDRYSIAEGQMAKDEGRRIYSQNQGTYLTEKLTRGSQFRTEGRLMEADINDISAQATADLNTMDPDQFSGGRGGADFQRARKAKVQAAEQRMKEAAMHMSMGNAISIGSGVTSGYKFTVGDVPGMDAATAALRANAADLSSAKAAGLPGDGNVMGALQQMVTLLQGILQKPAGVAP